MQKIINLSVENVLPTIGGILEQQGIPAWRQPEPTIKQLAQEAVNYYRETANPIGIKMDISTNEFREIFNGDGLNEPESPVKPIYEQSDNLALYAVTIGEDICSRISELFGENDFAIGSMLDSAASIGTELAAEMIEQTFRRNLEGTGRFTSRSGILRFSPGYCGWHMSGQKKLFTMLHPGDIGVTLNNSFLMQPLKSISGVIITGKKEIFEFDDTFSFCRDCATHTCRERIKSILEQ
ncbi:MAG: vitamin B12 dependent-methionine synthase activation domain-containing protein [Bacteroidota bacterium]